jgi:hypothetical protein
MATYTGEADCGTMSHLPTNVMYELPFVIAFLYNEDKQARKICNAGKPRCYVFPINASFGQYGHKSLYHSSTCALVQTIHSPTHSWSWALLEKLPIVQLLKNFPAFYGIRRFITAFTKVLHWSLSWARSIPSILSHCISLRSILILSTHLRLGGHAVA